MTKFILLAILLMHSLLCLSQSPYCLEGRVLFMGSKEPAASVSIKFYDSLGGPMRALVYSGEDGSFQACFDKKNIIIKMSGLTAKDTTISLTLSARTEQTFFIQWKPNKLDEIIVAAKKVARDTIDYVLDSLVFKEDDKLADILKQLPGFEVKNGNEIYHNNKLVKRLLMDGKDFLSDNKEIALDNFTKKHLESLSVYGDYKDPFRNFLEAERGELAVDLKSSKKLRGIPASKAKLFAGYQNRFGGDIDFMLLQKRSFTFLKNSANNLNEKPNFSQEELLSGSFYSSAYSLFNQALIGNRNFIDYANAYYKYQDDNTFIRVNIYPKYAANGYDNFTERNSEEGSYQLQGNNDQSAKQWYSSVDFTKKVKTFIASYSFLYDYVSSDQQQKFNVVDGKSTQNHLYNFLEKGHTLNHRVLMDKAFSERDILTFGFSSLMRFYDGNSVFSDGYANQATTNYKSTDFETSLEYKKQINRFGFKTSLDYSNKSENVSNILDNTQFFKLNINDFKAGEDIQFRFWRIRNDFFIGAKYNTIGGSARNWVYPWKVEWAYLINSTIELSIGGANDYYNTFSNYALSNRRTGIDAYSIGDSKLTKILRNDRNGHVLFSYLNSFKNRSFGLQGSLYENLNLPSYNVSVSNNRFLSHAFLSDQKGVSANGYFSYRISLRRKIFFDFKGHASGSQSRVLNKVTHQKEYDNMNFGSGGQIMILNKFPYFESFKLSYSIGYTDYKNIYKDNVFRQQGISQNFMLSYNGKKITANITPILLFAIIPRENGL